MSGRRRGASLVLYRMLTGDQIRSCSPPPPPPPPLRCEPRRPSRLPCGQRPPGEDHPELRSVVETVMRVFDGACSTSSVSESIHAQTPPDCSELTANRSRAQSHPAAWRPLDLDASSGYRELVGNHRPTRCEFSNHRRSTRGARDPPSTERTSIVTPQLSRARGRHRAPLPRGPAKFTRGTAREMCRGESGAETAHEMSGAALRGATRTMAVRGSSCSTRAQRLRMQRSSRNRFPRS